METMKNKLTFYFLPHRRRNCLIIYSVLFIFLLTALVHKIHITSRTWTQDDWDKLKPSGGIISYPHNYIISSESGCDQSATKLIVIIFSRPDAFSTRETLRKTWLRPDFMGQTVSLSVTHKFIFGSITDEKVFSKIKNESSRYGDIIIDDSFIDSYKLLVRKTIAMIDWVSLYCPQVEAVLKTDDDSWINLSEIINLLPSLSRGIHGHIYYYPGSSTDPDNEWYMPHEVYPFGHYPDFASGSGYLMVNRNTQLFRRLLGTIFTIRTIWTEDVFLTGLVAEKTGVQRYYHDGFNPLKVSIDNICQYKNIISSHKLTENEISTLYIKLTDPNLDCS